MNTSFIEEKIILIKIRAGKTDLFIHIYERYVESIYRYVHYKLPSSEVIEDVTSEVFARALEYVTNNERPMVAQLRPFLYQLARAAIADYYRSHSITSDIDDFSEQLSNPVDKGIDFSDLEKFLIKLPEDQREAVVLKYIEGLSAGEIGKIMGRSAGSVRVLIHRGLEKLREVMGDTPHSW